MAKTFRKIFGKLFPTSDRILRSFWYTLNGEHAESLSQRQLHLTQALHKQHIEQAQTLHHQHIEQAQALHNQQVETARALHDQQAVLDDARAVNLKHHLESVRPGCVSEFAIADSVQRLRQLGDSAEGAIAVVTVVPPAQTGVARFSVATFGAAPFDVDVFGPFERTAEYLGAHALAGAAGRMSFFTAESVAEGLRVRRYRAVIWVLANSDHNLPVLQLLRRMRHLPQTVPCWIEIHDPVLLNMADQIIRADRGNFAQSARLHFADPAVDVDWSRVERGDYSPLLEAGFAGVRTLLNDVPFSGLIVHSEAAKRIILRDWRDLDEKKVSVLFHPVFEPYRPRQAGRGRGLRIGSFGVPNESKLTPMVVAAFRIIRATLPDTTLVLAGYDAALFASRQGLVDEPGLIIEDNPGDHRLLTLMSGVDVAVQLRASDTGESSGIIPQLLAADIPTLVSPVGAMHGYGAAVRYVPPEYDAVQLADLILEEAREPARSQAAREAYAQVHTPARFCLDLRELIEGRQPAPRRSPPAGTPSARHAEPGVLGPEPTHWQDFERIMEDLGAARNPYVQSHLLRYRQTLAALEKWLPEHRDAALEIGTSWLFAIFLKANLGFSTVDVTNRDPGTDAKITSASFTSTGALQAFNLDLESDPIPVADAQYDLVLCCEVLEHLDVDPMFMLAEINRTMKIGGRLLLTTPNVTSSRNVSKILNGYAPHFYMQYHKDRSPYRHNIEYAPDQVAGLVEAAGYRIDRLWTLDTFEAPVPEAMDLLRRLQYPSGMRGDNMFVVATKTGPVIERHPPIIYV